MSLLARIQRDLIQYGFTADRIAFALSGRDAPRVLANSIPKAGTNLLIRALYLMYPLRRRMMRTVVPNDFVTGARRLASLRKGQIAAAHVAYSVERSVLLRQLDVHHVLIIRDPRDIAVSDYHYKTYQDLKHPQHPHYSQELGSDDERLLASITGYPPDDRSQKRGLRALALRLQAFLDWDEDPACLLVRFEDLVGAEGGGDAGTQMHTLQRINDHLGLKQSEDELRRVAAEVFSSGSRTFRRGQIGGWRDHWKQAHHEAAARTGLPALISKLGYPSSD